MASSGSTSIPSMRIGKQAALLTHQAILTSTDTYTYIHMHTLNSSSYSLSLSLSIPLMHLSVHIPISRQDFWSKFD